MLLNKRNQQMGIGLLTVLVFSYSAIAEETAPEPKLKGKPLSKWVKQIQHSNKGLAARAAKYLSKAPKEFHERLIPQLVPLLETKRIRTRSWAAQVLGNYGPAARSAVPFLLPMLQGTQYERNRTEAAKALGRILVDAKPSEEVTEVAKALAAKFNEDYDDYSDVRRESARALGMIGPAAKVIIPKLERGLKDYKKHSLEHTMVRAASVWTAGRMGSLASEHIDLLISMMHSERGMQEIPWAIGEIGAVHENVVPNLTDKMEKTLKDEAYCFKILEALEKFGPKSQSATEMIAVYIREKKAAKETIIQVLKTLKAIGPRSRKAMPQVKSILNLKSYKPWHKPVASPDELAEMKTLAQELMDLYTIRKKDTGGAMAKEGKEKKKGRPRTVKVAK